MSVVRGPERLDDGLWTPSPLGCVGPGLLQAVANGRDHLDRPLLALHRHDPEVLDGEPLAVEVVDDDATWDRLCSDTEVLAATGGRGWPAARHAASIVVVVREGFGPANLRAVLSVRRDAHDPRLGEVTIVWMPGLQTDGDGGRGRDVLRRGWLGLFAAAAARGVVGLGADVSRTGARDVARLREVAGFRPTVDCYAEVGLSAADADVVVDWWRAVVVDDEVTGLATRSGATGPAHDELVARLARVLPVRDEEPEPLGAPHRTVVAGPVTLDGCASWGSRGDDPDDWTGAGGIEIEDMELERRAWHRSTHLLAQWCRQSAGL